MKTNEEVKIWVREQHDSVDQKRVNGDPYWTHTERVGGLVSGYYKNEDDHDLVYRAALSHDILEDTPITYDSLKKQIGERATQIVQEVTNQYTKEAYPDLNREERKYKEAVRLGQISFEGLVVKLADIIDNLSDILESKPKMAEKYKAEKAEVLKQMISNKPYITNTSFYQNALKATK